MGNHWLNNKQAKLKTEAAKAAEAYFSHGLIVCGFIDFAHITGMALTQAKETLWEVQLDYDATDAE